ncbi:MAG: DUF4845 domain-containing protein [Betaproteobacteria bacterium]|nr:DUF4845 domain-containing protein [Betaproteobacteria bacterium]
MLFRQRGISLIGMIFVGLLLAGALLVGFRMIGPYREYFALQRIVGLVADEGNNGASESEMRKSYERRALIDSIDGTVKSSDLVFRKQGGKVVVEVEYTRKAPLVSNVSLSFDFKASSQHSRK